MRLLDALLGENGEEYLDLLPHGSGLDGTWRIMRKHNGVHLSIGYHFMDSNGYYAGWYTLTFKIPRVNPDSWKLSLHGWKTPYEFRDAIEEEMENAFTREIKERD